MFFGATTFAGDACAGLGTFGNVVNVTGNQTTISIGNTTTASGYPVTGSQISVATGSPFVVIWTPIDPNASGTWIPIDPLNP